MTVVLLPGVSVIGSVPAVKAKSLASFPVIVRLLITRLPFPKLLMVTRSGGLLVENS